jgi:hypothetical protein
MEGLFNESPDVLHTQQQERDEHSQHRTRPASKGPQQQRQPYQDVAHQEAGSVPAGADESTQFVNTSAIKGLLYNTL